MKKMKNKFIRIVPASMCVLLFSLQGCSHHAAHDHNMTLLKNSEMSSQMNTSDKRRPVRMTKEMSEHQLRNMRGHLEAITAIIGAMPKRDFKKMEKESLRLASSPKMTMMCTNMGKATPGFTTMGLALHSTADKLVDAAKKKDYDLFVRELGSTLRTCTSCHATFKQEVLAKDALHKFMLKSIK